MTCLLSQHAAGLDGGDLLEIWCVGLQEERVLGEALQQTEESGIAALEERLARRGESGSLAEAETALTSLLHKLSLKSVGPQVHIPASQAVP